MPGKYNYEIRHKYPHMIGEDSDIWSRFVYKFPHRFDTVNYDIKVGSGIDSYIISDNKMRTYWQNLTKKRIDVVAFKDDRTTIIEVKKKIHLFTLGQILGYHFLYSREYIEEKPISMLIVGGTIDLDDIDILNHYHINYIIV